MFIDFKWKGVVSYIFLEYVCVLVCELGYEIINIDCILICECFKIGFYVVVMCMEMVCIMGMDNDCVSVKVIIFEKLGFIGCEEGIVLIVIVILVKV